MNYYGFFGTEYAYVFQQDTNSLVESMKLSLLDSVWGFRDNFEFFFTGKSRSLYFWLFQRMNKQSRNLITTCKWKYHTCKVEEMAGYLTLFFPTS